MANALFQIALLVGSDGTAAAYVIPDSGDPDWGFMSDCLGVYDEKKREQIYPPVERRYVVQAFVEIPSAAPESVHGVVRPSPTEEEKGK